MILEELNALLEGLKIPVESGTFKGKPPDEYCVLTPLADSFEVFVDNAPSIDVNEARISLFAKHNYLARQKQIVKALLAADFTITSRFFVGFENDTGYYHIATDVAKYYEMEEQQ